MISRSKLLVIIGICLLSSTLILVLDEDSDGGPKAEQDVTIHYKNWQGEWLTYTVTMTCDSEVMEYSLHFTFWGGFNGSYPKPIFGLSTNEDGSGELFLSTGYGIYESCESFPSELWVVYNEDANIVHYADGETYTFEIGEFIALTVADYPYMTTSTLPPHLNISQPTQSTRISGIATEAGTWTISATGKGVTHTFTIVIKERSPKVSFVSNGSTIETQSVTTGGFATSITPEPMEGYIFEGWYSDEGLTTPFDFDTPIVSDTTLYAKWVSDVVTITFKVEGKVHSTLQVPRGSVGIVYTPVMVEGVFAGWYYDSDLTQKYDATRALDTDTTLYAYGVPPLIFTSEPNASANIQQVNSYGMFFFDATDSSGRYQIEWDFGDGNTSTDAIAYNTYSAHGVYTVTLKVTNIYGESSTTTYDVVYGDPAGGGENDLRYIVIALLCILGGGLVIRRII